MAPQQDRTHVERLRRANRILDDLLDRPTEERALAVEQACGDDQALRKEVDALLGAHGKLGGFLDEPAAHLLPAPAQPALEPGDRVGDYEIVGIVGKGGAGIVYEAKQERPARSVALKILGRGRGSTNALRRFEDEAEVLARLDHPDVAHVYACGVDGEHLWLALELVTDAQTLGEYARTLDQRRLIALLARIARVVHYGHQKGVVHCDLKPANILVRPDGRPKVIDFGIARVIGAGVSGVVAGTPGYISPEQLDGAAADVRSDVFALGVVLSELLEVERPDLQAIVNRALHADPEQRYQSALTLAVDLENYLVHRPVAARPASWPHQLALFTRRHTAVSISVFLLIGVVVASTIISLRFAFNAEQARRAERFRSYTANVAAASAAARSHDTAAARSHLAAAPGEHRGWEWSYLRRRLDQSVASWEMPDVHRTWVAANESTLLILREDWWSKETHFELRDPDTLESIEHRVETGLAPSAPRFLPDGALAWIDEDQDVVVLDPATRKARFVAHTEETLVQEIGVLEAGRVLVACTVGGQLFLFDGTTGKRTAVIGERAPGRHAFAVHAQRGLVAVASDAAVRLLDRTGAPQGHIPGEGQVTAMRLHGERIAVARQSGVVEIFDLEGLERVRRFEAPGAPPTCLLLDSERLTMGRADGALLVWDLATGRSRELFGHERDIVSIRPLPGGRLVSTDITSARVWDLAAVGPEVPLAKHPALVRDIDLSPDEQHLAAIDFTSRAVVYDAATGMELATLDPPDPKLRGQVVRFSPDGEQIIVAWGEGVERWNWRTDEREVVSDHHPGTFAVHWFPDGKRFAAGGTDSAVTIYGAAKTRVLHHPGWVRNFAITKDGRRLVSTAYLPRERWGKLCIWDVATGNLERTIDMNGRAFCMALSRDGERAVVGTDQRELHVFDVGDGRLLRKMDGLTHEPWALALSPDGSRLASAGSNGSIRIWDPARGAPLLDLHGHGVWVWDLVWDREGRRLFSCSGTYERVGAEIRVWDGG